MGYVRLCVEVFNGYRPVDHLRRMGGPAALDAVVVKLRQRTAASVAGRQQNSGASRYAGPHTNNRFKNLMVQRIRVWEQRDGIAEVVAVLAGEHRTFAVALRLELEANRWLCTLAQVI